MNAERPARLDWFKSSYSSGEGGACVEVAADPALIHVRDSKERRGPCLAFARSAWAGFVAGLERDRS
ncbi:DUF397 domain-containing protein [Streptomyces sp. enrichment culture]|uniref:DUF397 domain-containing protein n=1 Tax=Streptomyces sp. enrichment culture TaxID=1795815 RepID=UPI003F54CF51